MFTSLPTVWVVDDDDDDQFFIRSAFEDIRLPIRVVPLSDGDQVLPKLAGCQELPRLILLDINMARQNGFETLQLLRNNPGFADLPVLMLTTSASEMTGRGDWRWALRSSLPNHPTTSNWWRWCSESPASGPSPTLSNIPD